MANFALCVLSLPHSNAECERVFSKINLYKIKLRNKLKTDTVNGALLSSECIKEQKSCINFKPSEDMIARVKKSSILYQNVKDDAELE